MRKNASTVPYVMHARSVDMHGAYEPVQAHSKAATESVL